MIKKTVKKRKKCEFYFQKKIYCTICKRKVKVEVNLLYKGALLIIKWCFCIFWVVEVVCSYLISLENVIASRSA